MKALRARYPLFIVLAPLRALGADLGSGLWRDYTVYAPLPTNQSAASAEGWHADWQECDPKLGIRFSQGAAGGPTKDKPISLYFTPGGQLAGVGTIAHGQFDEASAPVAQGYWKRTNTTDEWRIDVTFRGGDAVCSENASSPGLLGDRAVINADTVARSLPMRQEDAIQEHYATGACFASMGTHSFFDLVGGGGNMTWAINNLMPVVPMYDRSADWRLNAVFFNAPSVQQSMRPPSSNQWEPIPMDSFKMCMNFCDAECGWNDEEAWSTMHIYFSDPHAVVCEDNCTVSCCESG